MTTPMQGLRTVIHPVADLAASKQWWTDLLGFGPYFDEPFYVGFNIGGYELGLDPDASQSKSGPGGTVVYWGVKKLDEGLARFSKHGAKIVSPAQDVGGDIRVATVADPFGNVIGLIENPHFALP